VLTSLTISAKHINAYLLASAYEPYYKCEAL